MTAPSEVITDDIHTLCEKARTAFDEERVSAKLVEALTEQTAGDGLSDIRDMIDKLTEFADALESAAERGSGWAGAEDREDKRDAREEFLDALETLAQTYDEITHDPTDDEIDDAYEAQAGRGAGDDATSPAIVAELLENLDIDALEQAVGVLSKMLLPLAKAQVQARS